jgi:hypothetical protein
MGCNELHALGRSKKVYIGRESTFGAFVKPTTAHGAKVLTCKFDFAQERKDTRNASASRSLQERMSGKKTVQYSIEAYLAASGIGGAGPDLAPMIQSVMGTVAAPQTVTVSDYASMGTSTVTVTINGAATVLTAGTSFTAETSNDVTATNLAVAIAALTGVGAAAVGAVVTVTPDAGYYDVRITSSSGTKLTVAYASGMAFGLSATQGVLGSCSITQHNAGVVQEAVWGALGEQMTIKAPGASEPTISFSGPCVGHAHTGTGTHDGALSGSETTLTVHAADVGNFDVGSVIQVGTSTDHLVTAASGTSLTVTPGISGGQSNDCAIVPYVPTETTVGTASTGLVGSIKLDDGSALPITNFEVTVKNNLKTTNDEFGYDTVTDYIEGRRSVTGTLQLRARKDVMGYLLRRKLFTTRDVDVVIGTTGSQITITMPTVEIDATGLEVPESEEAVFTLPFTALSTAGETEISLTFSW